VRWRFDEADSNLAVPPCDWYAKGTPVSAANVNSESQTRVTGLDELKIKRTGQECLVVIYAPSPADLGRRYVLNLPSIAIGRGRDSDILLTSDCVSRRHARLEQRADGLYLLDLDSTNGIFVNEEAQRVAERRLRRGDQFSIGDTIFKFLSGDDVESQYHDVVFRMAITDGLTGLANRKQLDTVLSEELPRAQRHGRSLSLLMIDIDHFKTINDSFGHVTGDSVLRGIATALQKRVRPNDKLGRYGGEEFCLVLPETSLSSAVRIAEEMRDIVANQAFAAEGQEVRVTVSIGAAAANPIMTAEQLYAAADEMLYKAKNSGRNRVCY
jgi:two-component system, cell cycle response regulator